MRAPFTILFLCLAAPVAAGEEAFKAGAAIPAYGKIADVPGAAPIPADAAFKIRFDLAKPADEGEINRNLDSAARFINMHAAAGVPLEKINLAMVIHGGAVKNMTRTDEKNAGLIKALSEKGVKFFVCGQSAAWYGVKAEDLTPGVEMSLSAMTAHSLLDAKGYSLNPF
ncbi:MAG: DsrE family protein [Pseudomonadota bacterium]